jgi:hypothetical protein
MYDYVHDHGQYPIDTAGATLDDLQQRYADYWEDSLAKLRAQT